MRLSPKTDPVTTITPEDVRGFEFGETAFRFENDKLVVITKNAPTHLTFHTGPHSKVMDIHTTLQDPTVANPHTTLFSIPHDKLALLLEEVGPLLAREATGYHRPLRPGWMIRNQIGAVLGLVPPMEEAGAVMKMRKKRLSVDLDKLRAQARLPEFIDELYELPDGHLFTLFSFCNPKAPRLIGIGFKQTAEIGQPRLFWIPRHSVSGVMRRMTDLISRVGRKYGQVHVEPPWF